MKARTPGLSRVRRLSPAIALLLLQAISPATGAEPVEPQPQPRLELPHTVQHPVGAIDMDIKQQRFSVQGKVISLEPGNPLEYLAVVTGGHKSYESLLEFNTSAREFNLACILIGLDAKKSNAPRYHFDPEKVVGDPVRLSISWKSGEETLTKSPGELFSIQGMESIPEDWVYTGSVLMENGAYLAEEVGTLIGFVHDPASIIEHRTGLGIGAYGAAQFDPAKLPPPGSVITLVVERPGPVPESHDP